MSKKIDYSKHTKDELVQMIYNMEDEKGTTQELLSNLNEVFGQLAKSGVGSAQAPQKQEQDMVLLRWQGSSLVPTIPDKNTGEIIVAFDKTFEVRGVPADKVRTLINQYRRLFKEGLLVFVNKEDAEREHFRDVPSMDEDSILKLLDMEREEMMSEVESLSQGVQRTILMHCAKKVQDEDPNYTKYAYDKIEYLAKKIGKSDLKTITSTLVFTRED